MFCRPTKILCGEFRQACDTIGACRAISDSATQISKRLVGSGGPRQFVGARVCLNQLVNVTRVTSLEKAPSYTPATQAYKRKGEEDENSRRIWASTWLIATKNRLVSGKLTDSPTSTNFNRTPTKNAVLRQTSASVRPPLNNFFSNCGETSFRIEDGYFESEKCQVSVINISPKTLNRILEHTYKYTRSMFAITDHIHAVYVRR